MVVAFGELFENYMELLLKWNERYNLTAITEPEAIRSHHFEDSLAPLPFVEGAHSCIDLGTGAGFPGIPLKIMRPDMRVVLVDATRKKISFVSEVIRKLGLKGIEAVQGRAEDETLQARLGTFDLVISRATWSLADYLMMAVPYMNDAGICIAMRGAKWRAELAASHDIIDGTRLVLEDKHEYTIGAGEERCLLIFTK